MKWMGLCWSLGDRTLRSLNEEDIPERIWIVGDSETVLANWPEGKRTLGSLGRFLGIELEKLSTFKTKIEMIASVGMMEEWWRVPFEHNAADRPSRLDSEPADIGLRSRWQMGPEYLKMERDKLPLDRFQRSFGIRLYSTTTADSMMAPKVRI